MLGCDDDARAPRAAAGAAPAASASAALRDPLARSVMSGSWRPPLSPAELDRLEAAIDGWLAAWARAQRSAEPAPVGPDDAPLPDGSLASLASPVAATGETRSQADDAQRPLLLDVTRDEDIPRRWYLRLAGESRDVIAVWLTLRQRTLSYETYVLPTPAHRVAEVYDFVLRRNYSLVGAQYGIGPEDALYLTGELGAHAVDEIELDRIVGSLWAWVERDFDTLVRLAFRR